MVSISIGKRIASVVAVTALFPFVVWAQQATLTGVITDRFSGKAIVGARVVIGGAKSGISGPQGDYRVDNLHDGESISVVYEKESYGEKKERVTLTGPQTQKDVILWPDTTNNVVWVELAQNVGSKAADLRDSTAKSKVFAQTWEEIDSSGISPEAKAAAAQALASAVPNGSSVPAGLKAYTKVDSKSIGTAEAQIQQALAGTNMPAERAVPPKVATDIAVSQVEKQEKTSSQPVDQKFYANFGKVYGDAASTELRNTVNMDRQSAGATGPK